MEVEGHDALGMLKYSKGANQLKLVKDLERSCSQHSFYKSTMIT